MDLKTILVLAGASAVAFLGSKLLVKADNRVEDRRRRAVALAAWCQANGLPLLSGILASYSVGNYSGVLFGIQQIHDVVADSDQSKAALDNFLKVQLDKRLSNTDEKAALIQYVEKKLGVKLTAIPAEEVKKELPQS